MRQNAISLSIKGAILSLGLSLFASANAENPLIKTMFTADPTARVMNGKLFVFPSSDVAPINGKGNNGFYMPYYHIFSSDNLMDWTDYGCQIDQNQVPWGQKDAYAMWAPDCIEKNGKYYYYFPDQPKGETKDHFVGVAIANKPEGPYKVEEKPIKGVVGIDPNVFTDDNGVSYLYWGSNDSIYGCKLKENMKELDGKPILLSGLPKNYKEASFMFKRNGLYYFTFSHTTPYRMCELSYCTGNSPLGPFNYKGAFMKRWNDCWTNHHSFVNYKGEWILFYHHCDISKKSKMRSICADYVTFDKQGNINMVTPTLRGIGICPASRKINLDRYSDISPKGFQISKIGDMFPANWELTNTEDNVWVKYDRVDFSNGDYSSVRVRCSSANGKEDRVLEIRENGFFGNVIAEVTIPYTVRTDDYTVTQTNLKYLPKGVINLFCTFKGGNGQPVSIDWIEFSKEKEQARKSLVDFFLPMKPQKKLVSKGIWGDKNVLPRDINNGIEDNKLKNWCYWDGGIVKDDNGKYHIYCSRWGQNFPHSTGWKVDSKAIHAVSDNIMGPYKDLGVVWPQDDNGKGSNVFGLRMKDGRYAVITSEITPGKVFVSDSPNGPFKLLGEIKVDDNGFNDDLAHYSKAPHHMSNVQIMLRPDGRYMLIGRSTAIMISDNGILGPYKIMTDRVYANNPDLPKSYNEDPTLWYSGGMYHIVYNHWPSKTSYHFTSKDGISNWQYRGIAFKKDEFKIFKYTNGVINDWCFVERPTAYVENGHVTHFIFSVLDVHKGKDLANDNHGSKIVVVPFDGKGFDEYMQKITTTK